MATKTFDELIDGATAIKNNELPESNTHNLVGGQLIEMATKHKESDQKSDTINVTTKFPLAAGYYYTSSTARSAVTAEYRKLGKKLLYQTDATTWIEEKFIGSAITDAIWNADANWLGDASKKDVAQLSESLSKSIKTNTGIYDVDAMGSNISKLTGFKDLLIENAIQGKIYTLISVEAPSSGGVAYAFSIFRADDNIGTNYVNVARISLASNPANGKVNYYSATGSGGEKVHALVKWEDITPGIYTTMWGNNYKLKESCFQQGNISNYLVNVLLDKYQENTISIARQLNSYDLLPSAGSDSNATKVNKVIKQFYIKKNATGNIYLAAFSNGYERTAGSKTYQIGLYYSGVSEFLNFLKAIPSTEIYDNSIVIFEDSTGILGVAIVDWLAVDPFSYTNTFTSNFIISNNCFNGGKNPSAVVVYNAASVSKTSANAARIVNGDTYVQDAVLELFFTDKTIISGKTLTLKTMYKGGGGGGYNITFTDQNNNVVANTSNYIQTALDFISYPRVIHELISNTKIVGYCFVDWSKIINVGVQGMGIGIVNSEKIDTLYKGSAISHYLSYLANSETKNSVQKLITQSSIYKDTVNTNSVKTSISAAIKEIYVEGGVPPEGNYLALSVVQRNYNGTWSMKLYQMPEITLMSSFSTTVNPESEGYKITPLYGLKNAYVLIDWSKLTDGTNYISLTAATYALSDKCFSLLSNVTLNHFLDIQDLTLKQLTDKARNVIEDPYFNKMDYWNSGSLNTVISGSISPSVGIKNGEKIASAYRTQSGYASLIQFKLTSDIPALGYSIGDWVKFGMYVRAKKATTGTPGVLYTVFADRYLGEGNAGNINVKSKGIDISEDWQWVEYTMQMQSVAYPKVMVARFDCSNVTDYTLENTFGVEVKQPMICFYKNGEEVLAQTGFQDNLSEIFKSPENSLANIIAETIYSAIYKIGNYNNDFQFDRLDIGEALISALQLKPNFNIPTEGSYLSTDIENAFFRSASPTLLDLLKAFAPYFYYNGEKRGTIVLYDENGSPFIFDKNGNKLILLTQ